MKNSNWDSYPSFASQDFFREIMEGHSKVREVTRQSPSRWDLVMSTGKILKVFITDVYTFSLSDYSALRAQHRDVDVIVSASNWNHFSTAASEQSEQDGVATLMLGRELMGALHELA